MVMVENSWWRYFCSFMGSSLNATEDEPHIGADACQICQAQSHHVGVSEGMNINVVLFSFSWLLTTDIVIVNHDQVTRTNPELTPPSPDFHTTPNKGCLVLDIFNMQLLYRPCRDPSTGPVFSGTRFELLTRPPRIRYLDHGLPWLWCGVEAWSNLVALHFKYDQARRRFVEWAQNEIAVVPDFHKRILFSDEAHFWLNGYVNKQNCRIWSEANPQVYVETPLHPEKLTVWCALWAGGIIGSYFFKNDEGHNELWFQQDGATCHTARATIDLLKYTFGDRLISRFGPVNWPPRSCNLTPLDYFLWGYVKSLVYADKPHRPCYCRCTATNVGKSHRKLVVQIGLHPSQPRQSYARNPI
ncbi:hypothetical protein TNCV_4246021 [Trichonephila clavipes]|nr:hypothetical protein TNCV_4246021 [Trichonephila clavipes]